MIGIKRLALAAAAVVAVAAAPGNWNTTVAMTPVGGHLLGNPAAKVRLTEYVSYTCPHCGHFEVDAGDTLKVGYVHDGRLAIEVRHVVRDPIDLTAAMLTNCGPKEKFFLNHRAFFRSQPVWLAKAQKASKAQQARWVSGSLPQRTMAIAADLGFYEIMAARDYDRATVNRCLADAAVAKRLADLSALADKVGVTSTPSFAINNQLLMATSDWQMLRPQLDARF